MLTIRELIKTLYNAFNQKLKNHRGNWEQNDPTADDYIKNRPFYVDETEKIIIVPEQKITIPSSSPLAELSLPELIEFEVGHTYEVKWNNKTYNCVAFNLDGVGAIGNQGIFGNGTNTGEPFIMVISQVEGMGMVFAPGMTGSHTIEVTSTKIKKLDKKYIPDLGLAPVATSGNYWDLDNLPTIYSDVVRYGSSQSLTTAQKNMAKSNIAAVSYESQSLTDAQKTLARNNIGAASLSSAVRYDVSQSLTSSQRLTAKSNIRAVGYDEQILNDIDKAQARTNIGAASTEDISDVVRYNTTQDLDYNYKEKARSNICAVGYDEQNLTDTQKKQARTNIGASDFNRDYNLLFNKPTSKKIRITNVEGNNYSSISVNDIVKYDASNNFVTCNDGDMFYGRINMEVTSSSTDEYGNALPPYKQCILYDAFEPLVAYCTNTSELQIGNTYNFVAAGQDYIRLATAEDKMYRTMRVTDISGSKVIHVVDDPVNVAIDTVETDPTLTIAGAAADAKVTGDAVTQLTEQKADKSELESAVTQLTEQKADKSELEEKADKADLEKLNTPKDYIILVDQVNGFKYRVAMRNGELVSYAYVDGIAVTSLPDKTTYMAGEYFDPTGMVVSTISTDGATSEVSEFVVDETYSNTYLTEDVTEIGVSYADASGEVYTTIAPVTVTPFDPAVVLVDFEYTANDDGTYTITDWKGTYNGEASTEIIVPNNGLIML